MIWKGRRESNNVIDQRSFGAKSVGGVGLLIGAVVVYLMGGNPLTYIAQNVDPSSQGSAQNSSSGSTTSADANPQEAEKKSFVSVVLADTEDVWTAAFRHAAKTYQAPKLVLFRGVVTSACGRASKASGPFYCPGDQRVYLDLGFFDELSGSLGANGEFARAYVIAHEVGHHVQHLLGLDRALERGARDNQASVQIELQADCLAGVWAKQTREAKNVIEDGDIEQAVGAAAAVGDDRLQKRSQGYVVPDSFTHGSSAQRVAAFREGYAGGRLQSCL